MRHTLHLALAGLALAAGATDWPQALGPDRNGILRGEPISPPTGDVKPAVAWHANVGHGPAPVVVSGGRVYAYGVFRPGTGSEALDDPASPPAVADGRLYVRKNDADPTAGLLSVFPGKGNLICLDLRRGPRPEGDLATGFTVVPPGPVSDRIEVELRGGLRNSGPIPATARVTLLCDGRELQASTVTLPAGASQLVQAWWPTTGQAGEHVLSCRVESKGTVVAEAAWPLRVVSSQTPALPWFQAGWLDLLGLLRSVYPRNRDATEEELRAVVDSMHRLGMRMAMVTYVEFQGHFFYPSAIRFHDRDMGKETAGSWLAYDAVEAILSQADRHGMHVVLGLGRGGDMGLTGEGIGNPERLQASIAIGRQVAEELWARYGRHPSLYGWYLTHETNDLVSAAAYYDPLADLCHALAPDKPVMVAPAGTPIGDSAVIRRSHVDVFAYQDAVGAGYMPGVYTYDPERRLATLEELYTDYQGRHQGTGKHLWTDLEIWEMAGPEYRDPYPPAWSRVARQLAAECRHVEMVTAYEVLGFLEAPGSALRLDDRRAEALYRAYEAYAASARAGGPTPEAGAK